jgi:uncharacterized repeat protein (TIGR01451 family)
MNIGIDGLFTITEQGQAIMLIVAGLSLMSALVRKATVDIKKVRHSRDKIKEHQKIIKEAQKNGDTDSLLKSQEEMMKHTMEQMKQNFKPMLITWIPLILALGFLATNYGDLHPAINVSITSYLPANITFENVSVLGNGTYNETNKIVVWNLPKVIADTKNSVQADLKITGGDIEELKTNKDTLVYYEANGTIGPSISTQLKNTENGSIMVLEKSLELKGENKITYLLNYENIASNNVIYFPIYFDFWIFHFHNGFSWFPWYFLVYTIFSIILSKALGLN